MKILDFLTKYCIVLCILLMATATVLALTVAGLNTSSADFPLSTTEICLISIAAFMAFLTGLMWSLGGK